MDYPSQLIKEEILAYLPLWNIFKYSSKSFENLPLKMYFFSKVNHSLLSLQIIFTSALSRLQFQSSNQLHSFTSTSLTVALPVQLHIVLHDWYINTLRSCFLQLLKLSLHCTNTTDMTDVFLHIYMSDRLRKHS